MLDTQKNENYDSGCALQGIAENSNGSPGWKLLFAFHTPKVIVNYRNGWRIKTH